ncbi:MAG: iron-containing alcohol dehydrogenase [Desulfovibrio sp.]|nr:MAG: iron-containing alcohol dehydrogenase [Desulfovibrio sp.]
MLQFNYYMPTRIIFGPGKLAELKTTPHLPGTKALIVTGASGSMQRAGHLDRVKEYLADNGVDSVVYAGITPNPTLDQIDAGADEFLARGCDFVLGLGGGSPIDSAKAIAVTAANGGSYWDYIARGTGGRKTPEHPAKPIVAIPTTAGTGTEADPWIVVSRLETQEKLGFGNESTLPVLSIVDPELMLSLPRNQTAYTGMDAFYHAVETSLATIHQPGGDVLAWDAVRLVKENLPRALEDGFDLEARTNLAWASTAAGICQTLSASLLHHVMEHSLSALKPELPHGLGLVILSRAFFRTLEERVPERFFRLAQSLGESAEQGELPFSRGLAKLIAACGLADECLEKHGFTRGDVPELVDNVYATVGKHFEITPTPLSREDVQAIFESSLKPLSG